MPEEQVLDAPSAEAPSLSDNLQNAVWGESPVKEGGSEVATTQAPIVETPPVNEWWKELEFQDADTAKNEIKRLKETKPQEEIKFANDQSRIVYDYLKEGKVNEVKEFLERQEKINRFSVAEVSDETAADIIKASMQLKYKDQNLTAQEIEYKFNKQYGIPKEPVFDDTKETDYEFEARKEAWEEQVKDIKMSRNIDAKLAKPELEKAKSELVLPDISKRDGNATKEPTQEELEVFEKQKLSFLQNADVSVKGFSGFTAQVKDKDVDYSVSYAPSQDEKTLVSSKMKEFAERGFDANAIFVDRWLNEDSTINEKQMTEDLSRIFMGKNADQKLAVESANQRLEIYLKGKKNINLNGQGGSGDFVPDNKTESQKLQEAYWGGN